MSTVRPIVGYYRVSTKAQGASGLGLEAQVEAIRDYASRTGARILKTYTEIESGKRADNRPELRDAIAHAKRAGATLVVAKLDRLARNVAFTSALMESGVEFVAVDNPTANRLTIHILAAVAEDEARRISQRTKDALGAAKRRGVRLGSARKGHWHGREDLRQKGLEKARERAAESRSAAAAAAYSDLLPEMVAQRSAGASLDAIAQGLNIAGHVTRNGKPWNKVQVSRVLARAKAK